jgi:hypothetical protein
MNSLSLNQKFTAERAVPVSKRRVYALGLVRFNLSSPTAGSAEDQGISGSSEWWSWMRIYLAANTP